MTNSRRRGINGGCKAAAAPDGSDPLPPDWEIRYPRNGAKDVYYYKSKTDKSTWTRPRLPNCGRSSPTKGGGAQSSGRRSPGIQDNSPKRTGRSQQLRATYRDANSRRLSPLPGQDLSYADRHYIPIEAPASVPTADSIERRGERDISGSRRRQASGKVVKSSVGPRRDSSPTPPQERIVWQQDLQAGGSDSGWGRSQAYSEVVQSISRPPSERRHRRKDDIEPRIRREDNMDTRVRRKDDVEFRLSRKGDIESRFRR
ncbi:hypothetical protein BD311DRAFT_564063 [Dichomitus squalens]|uniref:WW domain-containing protein n=1 Tax=Dichomitus squalens TaxID=114155 RepID=A0A4Q9MAS1_9APHY|nr:hypothetical protein BD311DRAFT_564063 [Dichomitus squalens]